MDFFKSSVRPIGPKTWCGKAVDFLGHQVSARGISLSERHMEAIKAIKAPTSGKEVQQLVGFLQHFSALMPQFSQLTALKNKRHLAHGYWTDKCERNLQELKATFAKPGLLCHLDNPNASKFEVQIDFSSQGLAACHYTTQRINGEAKLRFIDAT